MPFAGTDVATGLKNLCPLWESSSRSFVLSSRQGALQIPHQEVICSYAPKGRVQLIGFWISFKGVLSKKRGQQVHFQCHLLDKTDNSNKGKLPLFSIYHHQLIPTAPSSLCLTQTNTKFEVVLISTSYSPLC